MDCRKDDYTASKIRNAKKSDPTANFNIYYIEKGLMYMDCRKDDHTATKYVKKNKTQQQIFTIES